MPAYRIGFRAKGSYVVEGLGLAFDRKVSTALGLAAEDMPVAFIIRSST